MHSKCDKNSQKTNKQTNKSKSTYKYENKSKFQINSFLTKLAVQRSTLGQ